MSRPLPSDQVSVRGEEIYRRNIKPILGPDDDGKLVAIDAATGE